MNKQKVMDALANIGIRAVAAPTGAFAATVVDKVGFIGNMNPYLKGGLKILIGAIIPELHNKPNDKASIALASFGNGVAAIGGLDIGKVLTPGLISGANANILSGLTVDTDYKLEEEKKVSGKDIVGRV